MFDDDDVQPGSSPDEAPTEYGDDFTDLDDGVKEEDATPSAPDGDGLGEDDTVPTKNRASEIERKLEQLKTRDPERYKDILKNHGVVVSENQPPNAEDAPVLPWQAQKTQDQSPVASTVQQPASLDVAGSPVDPVQKPPTDFNEFMQFVKKEAREEAQREAQQSIQQATAHQKIEQRIMADYGEYIEQPNSELIKGIMHYINTKYGGNLNFAEEAAMFAARDLKIQPKSFRKTKALPRNNAPLPMTETGQFATTKPSLPKLSKRQASLAKAWGQDPKDLTKYLDENYGG